MGKKSKTKSFFHYLGKWYLTVPIVGFFSGLFLYYFKNTQIASFFVVAIVAFIASDLLTPLLIRGGKGICQVTLYGTLTVPEGYGFLAFFLIILGVSIAINVVTDWFNNFL